MFKYNSEGVEIMSGFQPIPDGDYKLVIVKAEERVSSKGNPMVTCDLQVVSGNHSGKQIRYHNVTFLEREAKGAGMAVHFLKCIGEPWEGEFTVDASHWVGKSLMAKVCQLPDLKGILRNQLVSVEPALESFVPF